MMSFVKPAPFLNLSLLNLRLSELQAEELNKLDDEAAPSHMSESLIQQFIKSCSPAVESACLVYDDYIKTPLEVLEREMSTDSEEDSLSILVEPVDIEGDIGMYSQIAESIGSVEEGVGISEASGEVIQLCELIDNMLEECFEVRHLNFFES